ncbi:MAG: flavodoxin family protein [Tannerellaceae bacterium]|nr:flavodoxin family protein [Tannerellaceae bacterium]
MVRRDALKNMLLMGCGTAASLTPAFGMDKNTLVNQESRTSRKVLLVNGSPRKEGCTYTALTEVAGALQRSGVDSEMLHVGSQALSGCKGCGACRESARCVIEDTVNEVIDRLEEFDGFVFGTPVHYASASGFITPFLDRLFFASSQKMAYKPGAAIASCRRGGSIQAVDQLNKYFTINNMPVVSSRYWNMVYGNTPEEVRNDKEGMQIMRTLGNNMAWMIQSLQIAKAAGISIPEPEPRT